MRTSGMTHRGTGRRWRRAALGAVAAVGLSASMVAPAQAGLTDPPPRPGEGITWGTGGKVKVKSMRTGNGSACSFIASPNSIGGVCVHANAFNGPSIEQILGGDPLPTCWDERLTDEELYDINLQHGDGTGWYWHRCLRGIDPETLEIEEGGLHFEIGIWPFDDNSPDLVFLTPNQQAFVDRFVQRGNVPAPVLVASPNPVPWVNDDVAFFNYGDDELAVDMSAPGVQMRAKITEILVYPEGRTDGEPIACDGPGLQVEAGDTPESVPDACWYTFERSSLDRPGDYFDAEIHAKWQVDVRIDGVWQPFHEFSKGAPAMVMVNEVQALVRP